MLGYVYQVLVMLTGLWLTPFFLRHLGQHDYGLWLTGLQIMSYLMLADFGILALLPRTVAYATGRAGDSDKATDLPGLIGRSAIIVLLQTPFVALAASIVWLWLPGDWNALRGPIGWLLTAFTVLFPARIARAILDGLQEQSYVARANTVAWAASLLCNIVLVKSGFGLYALSAGWVLYQTVLTGACTYRLRTRYRHVFPSGLPRLRWAEGAQELGRGFWVSLSQIGQVLMNGTDLLIISKALGPSMVVPYACTGKLASVLTNQPQMVMQVAIPGLSEMRAGAPKDRLRTVSLALSQAVLLLTGLLATILVVVNEGFVHWWVGSDRYAGFTLTGMILASMMLRQWNMTFIYTLFCFGYERRLTVISLLDALVSAGVMFLAAPILGYRGVAAGSIAGACLVSLPINMITLAREFDVSLIKLVLPFWPWAWRFALIFSASTVAASMWTPRSVVEIIAAGLVAGGTYSLVLLPAIMKSALGPYLHRFIGKPLARIFRIGTVEIGRSEIDPTATKTGF